MERLSGDQYNNLGKDETTYESLHHTTSAEQGISVAKEPNLNVNETTTTTTTTEKESNYVEPAIENKTNFNNSKSDE